MSRKTSLCWKAACDGAKPFDSKAKTADSKGWAIMAKACGAGAMEGTILGITSIALSQGYAPGGKNAIDWSAAQTHGPKIIRDILALGVPRDVLVNVNFPARAASEIAGVSVTVQGRRDANLAGLEERFDGRGNPYYWIRYARTRSTPPHGTDLEAIANGRISITPLRIDLTDEPTLTRFALALG